LRQNSLLFTLANNAHSAFHLQTFSVETAKIHALRLLQCDNWYMTGTKE